MIPPRVIEAWEICMAAALHEADNLDDIAASTADYDDAQFMAENAMSIYRAVATMRAFILKGGEA